MLFVNQICKSFNRTRVIDNITFNQSSNEFIALMGKNGSGKTTTLRMIARVMRPDSGNILFHNNDLLSHKSIFRSKILYLGHEPGMYSHFSPFENLQFALSLRGLKISKFTVETNLNKFGLIDCIDNPISFFSKGMLQRLKLVLAHLVPWDLLLFDEPFSGLDKDGIDMMSDQFNAWKNNGKSVIMVVHDEKTSRKFADRILTLRSGKIENH